MEPGVPKWLWWCGGAVLCGAVFVGLYYCFSYPYEPSSYSRERWRYSPYYHPGRYDAPRPWTPPKPRSGRR